MSNSSVHEEAAGMRDAQHRQTTQGTGSLDDLEVVLVSYRSRHHVEELLDLWGPQVAAVLVDNAHGADGLEELAAQRPNVRYVDGGYPALRSNPTV